MYNILYIVTLAIYSKRRTVLANPTRLDPITKIEVRFLSNPVEHQPLGSGFHFCPKPNPTATLVSSFLFRYVRLLHIQISVQLKLARDFHFVVFLIDMKIDRYVTFVSYTQSLNN
jgi:hypothetical protein